MSEIISYALQMMTPEERAALRNAYPKAESTIEAMVRRILERYGIAERVKELIPAPDTDPLAAINAIYIIRRNDGEIDVGYMASEKLRRRNSLSGAFASISSLLDFTDDPVITAAVYWALREWPGRIGDEVLYARRQLAGEIPASKTTHQGGNDE